MKLTSMIVFVYLDYGENRNKLSIILRTLHAKTLSGAVHTATCGKCDAMHALSVDQL